MAFTGPWKIILLTTIIVGIIMARDASKRGRSTLECVGWFLFTLFLLLPAVILYYFLVVRKYRKAEKPSPPTKAPTSSA